MKRTTKRDGAIRRGKAQKPSVFPAHLGGTPEDWRALKRTQWLEVMQALDRFMYGSAYVPARAALWTLVQEAERVTEAMKQKDWIAW